MKMPAIRGLIIVMPPAGDGQGYGSNVDKVEMVINDYGIEHLVMRVGAVFWLYGRHSKTDPDYQKHRAEKICGPCTTRIIF